MHSEITRLQLRSMSEGDLGSIAKRMIGGALNDRDQMAKLHRAIYEELYFQAQQKFGTKKLDNELIKVWSQKKAIAEEEESLSVNESKKSVSKDEASVVEKNDDSFPSDQLENFIVQTTNVKNRNKNSVTIKISDKRLDEVRPKKEEAFDIWKREKTKTSRRLWKEERIKKQKQLAAQQNEYEKRRASYEAYIHWKKLQASQRKVNKAPKKTMKDDCLRLLVETNKRIRANEEAFRLWKKQKSDRPRQQSQQRRQVQIVKYDSGFEFGAWLDRLDLVLHQKYMRERRYLVRSFYCQPAYYGTAALFMS